MPDAALEEAKADRWRLMKVVRAQMEAGGCRSALGVVDTDPDSQRRVSGAVTMALIAQAAGQPFSIDWTMRDNGSVTHDAPAMIAMGVAVGSHVAACHAAAQIKREQIEAAEAVEAVRAVTFEGGWPDAL